MDGVLAGRIALVTGGGAGIGLASAQALALAGAELVIADLDGDAAEAAAATIRRAGGAAIAQVADVSRIIDLEALFESISRRFGRLHILFSHAGTQSPHGLCIDEATFDNVIAANLKSHYFATMLALPLLRLCVPHAAIIYTSSTAGLRPSGRAPLYSVTKAAILALMQSVARIAGPDGIRVNAICPGPVDTGFARTFADDMDATGGDAFEQSRATIPLRRIATPASVAAVVAFLASDAAADVTGVAVPVDGGATA